MARRKRAEYPRVIYGPHGTRRTIHGPAEWIRGWTSHPQTEGVAKAPVKAEPIPLTRAEIKQALRERGEVFDETAATSALWRLLDD